MPKPKKSSKKVKISLKQKQTTKQSVIVNVRNVINERRRRPAPKPKEVRDTVTLQPRSSFLGNNLMMGNVSRYVQPAMAFAVNPPQLPMQQTAVVDKPLGKPIPPKQRPDVFDGEETDPYDIRQAKKAPELPVSEPFGVQRALYESSPMATASASSSSGFGLYAPRPPPPAFIPEAEIGPAQAFGGPPVNVQQAILPEEKEAVLGPADIEGYMQDRGYNFTPEQTYTLLKGLGLDTRGISPDEADWTQAMNKLATRRLYEYLITQAGADLKAKLEAILDEETEKQLKVVRAQQQQTQKALQSQRELEEFNKQQREEKARRRK